MRCLPLLLAAGAIGLSACDDGGSKKHPAPPPLGEISKGDYVTTAAEKWAFPLVAGGAAAPIVVDAGDHAPVKRVVADLQADVKRVTGVEPAVASAIPGGARQVVLVGTLGHSALIDALVASGQLDVTAIAGKWETFLIQPVEAPAEGVERALVVVGSDARGAIYGAYDVSRNIGVSPWYWWDDVTPAHQDALYVRYGRYSQGTPAVKFRGFFINDENPQTGRWARKTFGPGLGVIHKPTCTMSGCTWSDIAYPGGLRKEYWEKVFEVALRLRANYFWPAVWGRQFAYDDPENLDTVAKYGIVYGTSHEAPMGRGIEEWNQQASRTHDNAGNVVAAGTDAWGGNGDWSFVRNPEALKAYWREGIQRIKDKGIDAVVTMAMRGQGDFPPTDYEGGKEVMEGVLAAQRDILDEVLGEAQATAIPKVWLLYKEVQTYWDHAQGSLRPPEDVTIVWCDDNWGNMRKLQAPDEPPRSGGYGIYYHFDYVGADRNYKWIDTQLLPNVWEQLHLVHSYGVDRLWVVNVGDMKNEEVPLQFFLDYAWDPSSLPIERIGDWERRWARQQFGAEQAEAIAEVLRDYSKLQSDRKPELLNRRNWLDETGAARTSDQMYFASGAAGARTYYDMNPFSLTHYREMERVVDEWLDLAARLGAIEAALPADKQDAFFELVEYEVAATANLYALRLAQFKNILHAAQGRVSTPEWAAVASARFAQDQALSDYYNEQLAGGKWWGWQTQPKIGYGDQDRYGGNAPWQQPERSDDAISDAIFPPLVWTDFTTNDRQMGVTVDGAPVPFDGSGATSYWTTGDTIPLPTFSPYQSQDAQWIEVFSRGRSSFGFEIQAPDWLTVTLEPAVAFLDGYTSEARATLTVNDWAAAGDAVVTVTGNGQTVTIPVVVAKPELPDAFAGFVEANGYVSMAADHYSRKVDGAAITWTVLPDIGRKGNGITPFPVTAAAVEPGGESPRLEYDVLVTNPEATAVAVNVYVSPRNNVRRDAVLNATANGAPAAAGEGLKYAVSVDDGEPQLVDVNVGMDDIFLNGLWGRSTSNNAHRTTTALPVDGPGAHTVKLWMVDPGVVFQNVVVDTGTGELAESYFGPPESLQVP